VSQPPSVTAWASSHRRIFQQRCKLYVLDTPKRGATKDCTTALDTIEPREGSVWQAIAE